MITWNAKIHTQAWIKLVTENTNCRNNLETLSTENYIIAYNKKMYDYAMKVDNWNMKFSF